MLTKKIDLPASQSPLPLMGGVGRGKAKFHTALELMGFSDERELAIEMMRCDPVHGRRDGYYADHLGLDRSPWSKMLNGRNRFALTAEEWDRLEELTGCHLAHERWKGIRKGLDLYEHQVTAEEKAALWDAQQEMTG